MFKRTILITGASSGIGFVTAKLAAERGHTVIASAPTAALLKDVPANVAMKVVIDICDVNTITAALAAIAQAGLTINCLINNAGYAQPGPMELVDEQRLRKQFDVNFFGTLAITRAVLPLLRDNELRNNELHDQAAQGSRIITLSSMLGQVSLPYQGAYAASKFAIEAAFEALRMEVRDFNIDVVLIEPGWISTAFLKTAVAQTPPQWLEHPAYGKSLANYFALSAEAETAQPVSAAAKMAAAMAGSAQQVAETIVVAVETRRPKARYPVTAMARWLPRLARILPTALWDKTQTGQFSR